MNELALIENTYRAAKNRIENLPELLKALNSWYLAYPENNFLHPCVIEEKTALVCQRNLSQIAADAYGELAKIAEQYGIYLKEDKRTRDSGHDFINRRKNLSIVLTFCLGLVASSRLVTAGELNHAGPVATVTANLSQPANPLQEAINAVHLGDKTIVLQPVRLPTAGEVIEAYAKNKPAMKADDQAETKIRDFLLAAYKPAAGDPAFVAEDFAAMAHYFAEYPQAIELLNELQQKKVTLKYKPNNWQTQAWGNQYTVDSVTIFFDTRVAAQLLNQADCQANPACDVSPADALLHELLHAKLMLIDTQHFIESGGMQLSRYPYEHEHEVIANENRLYDEMNQQDGLSRPIRHQHSGKLYHVNCSACMPAELIAAN